MRTAHFDPFAGASGDMVVGALLDAGAPLEALREAAARAGLDEVRLSSERVRRCGLAATRFVVEVTESGHGHGHGHGHRRLPEVLEVLDRAGLPSRARDRAEAAFRLLARAEGRVHGIAPEEVHFHEVGAADSLADVIGAAAALEALGVEEVTSGPPALGHDGFVECAHGRLPVPAPAVLEILSGREVRPGLPGAEMTTPTGAALLTSLTRNFGPPPEAQLRGIGCGAGSREDPRLANVLRVVLGERRAPAAGGDLDGGEDLVELAATLDDLGGQVMGYLFERLDAEGALEVSVLPATLKKSRPGFRLTALVPAARLPDVARAVFRETPTLGLRWHPVGRMKLDRRFEEVATSWGPVKVKCGLLSGEVVTATPEYEDCRRLAVAAGVPLRQVQAEAARLFAARQD